MSGLPRGWAEARLDQIAEVRLGRQRSPKNHTGLRMTPYLRAANVTWDGLDLSDVKEMNFTEAESAVYELRPGDLVLAEASGSASEVGKPALWRGEIPGCCFQNTLVRVRSRVVEPRFLLHYFNGEARAGRIGDASKGVGIHHIGSQRLASWAVQIPPLNEQQQIVEAIEEQFSRLDAAEEFTSRATRLIDGFTTAVLHAAIDGRGSPMAPLCEVAILVTDGDHNPPQRVSTGVPHLTAKHVRGGRISTDGSTFVSDAGFERTRKRYDPQPGDVIVTCVGTIGESAVVPKGLVFSADRNLAAIRLAPGADPDYVRLALATRRARRLMGNASGSTAQPHLYLRDLRALEIPMPAVDDQRRIVVEIERQLSLVDAMRAAIETAQRRSASLRRAILDRAFRGELVPQDPSDEPASVLLERIRTESATSAPARRSSRRHSTSSPQ